MRRKPPKAKADLLAFPNIFHSKANCIMHVERGIYSMLSTNNSLGIM
jgi:hypothetical protein